MKKKFHLSGLIAGIFVATLTLIGLSTAEPVAQNSVSAEGIQSGASADEAPSALVSKPAPVSQIVTPAVRLSQTTFAHDLRRPRAPRHRGERPSSFSAEHESLAAATMQFIIHDDIHRPFVAEVVFSSPLSGHPLELLRPPSARAA